jgi:hypothetical protein
VFSSDISPVCIENPVRARFGFEGRQHVGHNSRLQGVGSYE